MKILVIAKKLPKVQSPLAHFLSEVLSTSQGTIREQGVGLLCPQSYIPFSV